MKKEKFCLLYKGRPFAMWSASDSVLEKTEIPSENDVTPSVTMFAKNVRERRPGILKDCLKNKIPCSFWASSNDPGSTIEAYIKEVTPRFKRSNNKIYCNMSIVIRK